MRVLRVVGINGQGGLAFSHRVAIEFELAGALDQAVQNGISQSGITDNVMPLFDRHLTGHDGGT